MKIKLSHKDLERIRYETLAMFAFRQEPLLVLIIKEYTGFLKRNGVDLDIEIEEEVEYD